MTLKLDRLPQRSPTKLTISVSPELKGALDAYAEIYAQTYGQRESVAELIPFMLDAFINADPGFRRARRTLEEPRADVPPSQTDQPLPDHTED